MGIDTSKIQEYLNDLPEERRVYLEKLRDVLRSNLPHGFEERLENDGIAYVVPYDLYPAGYHCDPKQPLPFISIASRKNFIALYHMGIYANEKLLKWFQAEYPKHVKTKLDMGKSCIRFKKPERIPFELIGELAQKMSPKDWIDIYDSELKR